ncbi:MAG TPA: LytTR family DNA-binding domain-containing protein [Ferruginibacter sp.]|nr:LytTR family DNA-binding domain-containing protein [Ferruginibacter sp.]
MLRILIIEDEEPAANRLQKMIKEIEPDAGLLGSIPSVSSAIKWFEENPLPDLIFSDIQLADGTSFDIFREVKIECPIIFVTAFDQYAIEAFKVNSVDYLLKPLKKDELLAAINKYKTTRPAPAAPFDISKLLQAYSPQGQQYKTRFIIRYGEHIKTIHTDEIAYFYTEDKVNFLTTFEGRRYAIDFNLDNLETHLDPKIFFRINRQFIVSINSIAEMFAYTKGRVLIKLKPAAKQETIVSTERSADFKLWLDGGSIK